MLSRDVRHNLSVLLLDRRLDEGLGDAPALRWRGGEWTYAELARRTGSAAGWLAGRGVGRGDLVLLALPDSPAWVALFLGAGRIGAACALASPGLPPALLDEATRRLAPALVLTDACGTAEDGAPDPGPAPVRADDLAYLLLTSGSTAPPRWVLHRAGDIGACIATYGRRVLRLRPGDVTWSAAALPTSYGLGNSCYFPLGAGACAVIEGADRGPDACAAACREHGVTALLGVPTSWARLARHVSEGRIRRDDLASVRLAVSAGEPLPGRVWRAVMRATGLRLVNGLGSSEASNLYLSDRPGAPRPGTVGWPVPGYRLRLEPGEGDGPGTGELLVQGPTTMMGYDDGTSAVEGGWLRTGDVLRREADGSHTFLRRAGDRFKAGALWVDAARVRDALVGSPDVVEAVAMPVRDGDGLLCVAAAIVPAGPGEAGLRERVLTAAAAALAPHEVPRVLLELSALPTTPSGKLDRSTLGRWMRDALAAPTRPRTVAV